MSSPFRERASRSRSTGGKRSRGAQGPGRLARPPEAGVHGRLPARDLECRARSGNARRGRARPGGSDLGELKAQEGLRGRLKPAFTVDYQRETWNVEPVPGTRVEVALDRGEALAGSSRPRKACAAA